MANIKATVIQIQECDSLHLVKLQFADQIISMISLELSENIQKGRQVILQIKPTNVSIAKSFENSSSFLNTLDAKVVKQNNGKILSSVILKLSEDVMIESIITQEAIENLELKDGEDVIVLIKESDISIQQVCDV